jgi:hypothetical protein
MKKGKHSFLTPYRLEKLNQIGFVWQVRTNLDEELEEESDGKGAVKEEETVATQLKNPPNKEGASATKTNEELVAEAAAAAIATSTVDATKPQDQEDTMAIATV